MGSGGPSTRNIVEAAETLKKEKSSKKSKPIYGSKSYEQY